LSGEAFAPSVSAGLRHHPRAPFAPRAAAGCSRAPPCRRPLQLGFIRPCRRVEPRVAPAGRSPRRPRRCTPRRAAAADVLRRTLPCGPLPRAASARNPPTLAVFRLLTRSATRAARAGRHVVLRHRRCRYVPAGRAARPVSAGLTPHTTSLRSLLACIARRRAAARRGAADSRPADGAHR
jgi:hypothetical protein